MLHQKLHKWVHRIAGGSVALAGVLMTVQGVDLTPILGEAAAAKALAGTGVFIAALEALPIVASWFDDEAELDPAPSPNADVAA